MDVLREHHEEQGGKDKGRTGKGMQRRAGWLDQVGVFVVFKSVLCSLAFLKRFNQDSLRYDLFVKYH